MTPRDVRYLRRELEECSALLESLPPGGNWKRAALKKRLQRTADQLAEILWEVSKQIAAISDPELRLIFELRWFRGFSWAEVARNLPTALSPDGARMKYHRYLSAKKSAGADFFPGFSPWEEIQFSNRKDGSVG